MSRAIFVAPCRAVASDRRGVAAIEMALLLPLMLLVYATLFEFGRGWLAKQKFEAAVEAAARFAARHPEFEQRVRTGVPVVVREMARPLDITRLNLTLYSAVIKSGGPELVFPQHHFFGNDNPANWQAAAPSTRFAVGEAVIVVTGSYTYTPLLLLGATGPITFRHHTVLNPYFSRSYRYQPKDSDWNYYNVK